MTDLTKMTGGELANRLDELFASCGTLTRDELYAQLQTYADEMNRRGSAIAKKYNKRYRNLTPRDLTHDRDAQMAHLTQ